MVEPDLARLTGSKGHRREGPAVITEIEDAFTQGCGRCRLFATRTARVTNARDHILAGNGAMEH